MGVGFIQRESGLISGTQNSNKHVIGTGKSGHIRNSGTVALSGPMTIDIYRGTFGTRKKWSLFADGRIIGPVVQQNFTVSSSIFYS